MRINFEICIGLLKGCFQSLRGSIISIGSKNDHARAVFWMRACCVLQNILIEDLYNPEWSELKNEDDIQEDLQPGELYFDP